MATTLTTKELRNMTREDLLKDLTAQRGLVARLNMGIRLQKEKDTAKYRREKRALARMMTILTEKNSSTPPRKRGTPPPVEEGSGVEGKPALKKASRKPKISSL